MLEKAENSRLRWRCRRGTTELDRLLGWFLEQRYAHVDNVIRLAFSALLDEQDPDLWDWLMGRAHPNNPHWLTIIDQIRSQHCL